MRRIDRKRVERLRRRVVSIGLSFAVGALAAAALIAHNEAPVPRAEPGDMTSTPSVRSSMDPSR